MKKFIIFGGILLRLMPHVPNFAPISAIALFAGANLGNKFSILIPLITIAISDYLLLYINPFGNPVINLKSIQPITAMFHSTTLYVWGSFAISGLIGIWLKKHQRPSWIVAASFLASVQFFLITNLGVWKEGMYSRGLDGLLQSYLMGLPFFKWTLLGDSFYSGVFFLSLALATRVVNLRSKWYDWLL